MSVTPPSWLLSLRETQVSPECESYFYGVLSVSKFKRLVRSVCLVEMASLPSMHKLTIMVGNFSESC